MKELQKSGAIGYACIWDEPFPVSVIAGFTSPSLKGDVLKEMPQLFASIGKTAGLAYMKQVHGPDVKMAEGPGVYECDGLFTRSSDLALVVRTADCLPLVFYSEKERALGVVHMGWRSAAGGILENTGFDLSSFSCVAGVGLRSCCYRVGDDFLRNDRLKTFVTRRKEGHYFDPVDFARRSLIRNGLRESGFFDTGICSHCSPEKFHSHRRNGTPDRTLSFIVKS
jgi:YfiH family protein